MSKHSSEPGRAGEDLSLQSGRGWPDAGSQSLGRVKEKCVQGISNSSSPAWGTGAPARRGGHLCGREGQQVRQSLGQAKRMSTREQGLEVKVTQWRV